MDDSGLVERSGFSSRNLPAHIGLEVVEVSLVTAEMVVMGPASLAPSPAVRPTARPAGGVGAVSVPPAWFCSPPEAARAPVVVPMRP